MNKAKEEISKGKNKQKKREEEGIHLKLTRRWSQSRVERQTPRLKKGGFKINLKASSKLESQAQKIEGPSLKQRCQTLSVEMPSLNEEQCIKIKVKQSTKCCENLRA